MPFVPQKVLDEQNRNIVELVAELLKEKERLIAENERLLNIVLCRHEPETVRVETEMLGAREQIRKFTEAPVPTAPPPTRQDADLVDPDPDSYIFGGGDP